jgi:hypothetical protein
MRTLFAVALLAASSSAADPKPDALPAHASGVALVEVSDVSKYDLRRVDGDAGVLYKLKRVSGSFAFRSEVYVTTHPGGFRPRDSEPKPSLPLKPDSFQKGDRFWVAFASPYDRENHTQGVLAFWPEKAAPRAALEAAVKADAYKWHPLYAPELKLSIGRLVEKGSWRVRAERDGKPLWEHKLDGAPTDASAAWGLYQSFGGEVRAPVPKCGQVLFAETHTELAKGNEFDLPPGAYYLNRAYDPETGKLHALTVRLPQGPSAVLVERDYDPATGKPTRENRYTFLETGGKAAGAKAESWYRKVRRTFDAAGKVAKEETFRYEDGAAPDTRWVLVTGR